MKTVGTFQVKSLKDAKLVSGQNYAIVAKSEKFEIWGNRHRGGADGDRFYRLTFSALRILSAEPRKFEHIALPDGCCGSVPKIIKYLESLAV